MFENCLCNLLFCNFSTLQMLSADHRDIITWIVWLVCVLIGLTARTELRRKTDTISIMWFWILPNEKASDLCSRSRLLVPSIKWLACPCIFVKRARWIKTFSLIKYHKTTNFNKAKPNEKKHVRICFSLNAIRQDRFAYAPHHCSVSQNPAHLKHLKYIRSYVYN